MKNLVIVIMLILLYFIMKLEWNPIQIYLKRTKCLFYTTEAPSVVQQIHSRRIFFLKSVKMSTIDMEKVSATQ